MATSGRNRMQSVCFVHVCVFIGFASVTCLTQSQLTEFESAVKKVLSCRNIPAASISLVKHGKVLMEKTFGEADPEKGSKVKDDTRFCIGSLTKAFTSIVISKLVNEQNNVTFDTPIRDIIGDSFHLSDDLRTKLVSLRDLLSHRVGVPGYFKALLVGFPETVNRKEVIRRLQYMPASEPLRTKFLYSNYMYTLAGYVAERMTGKAWETLVQEYIMDPLGMSDSGFINELLNFTNFALPVAVKDGKIVNLDPMLLHAVHPCGPAGSMYSTSRDMAKWVQLLLNQGRTSGGRRVFESSVVKDTFEAGMPAPWLQPNLKKPKYPIGDVQMTYDMAWITSVYRGYKLIWHSGGIITHASRLWMFPDMGAGIYAAVNGPQTRNKGLALRAIMSYAADMLLGETPWLNSTTLCTYPAPWDAPFVPQVPPEVTESMKVTARPVEDYIGGYFHRAFGEIQIELKEGTTDSLVMKFGRFGSYNLYPRSETLFHGRFYGPLWFMTGSDNSFEPEIIKFVKHKNNKISGLIYSIDQEYNSTMFSKGSFYPLEQAHIWNFACPVAQSSGHVIAPPVFLVVIAVLFTNLNKYLWLDV